MKENCKSNKEKTCLKMLTTMLCIDSTKIMQKKGRLAKGKRKHEKNVHLNNDFKHKMNL